MMGHPIYVCTYPPLESGRGKTGGGTSSSSGLGEIALRERKMTLANEILTIATKDLAPSPFNVELLSLQKGRNERKE